MFKKPPLEDVLYFQLAKLVRKKLDGIVGYLKHDQLFDSPQGFAPKVSGNGTFDQAGRRSSGMIRPLFDVEACWSSMDLSWPDWNALVLNGKKLRTNPADVSFECTPWKTNGAMFTWDFPPIWNPEKHGSSLAILRSRGWVVWVIFQLEPFVWILSGMWWLEGQKTDTPWRFSRVQNALLKGNVFKLLLFWASYVIKDSVVYVFLWANFLRFGGGTAKNWRLMMCRRSTFRACKFQYAKHTTLPQLNTRVDR